MPDWKKEIKLTDLVPGKKAQAGAKKPALAPRSAAGMSAARKQAARRRGRREVQLVGLKIGSSQLSAAVVANNGGPKLTRLVREPLADGIVAGGEVRDGHALAAALDAFFTTHKLPRQNVRIGLASTRVGVRAFEISGIDDEQQLANAIVFRAQETLPIPFEDAVVDYQLLSDGVDDAGVRTARALLVVAYRELVDSYVAACQQARIHLAGIDLEGFALLRALGAPAADGEVRAEGALVAVAIGANRSTLAVSDGHVCEFTRVLDWGSSAVTAAIAGALAVETPEAEQIKRVLSLSETVSDTSDERIAKTLEAARGALQTFARELVSSLRFYQGQPGSLPIREIVLTGGGAHLGGLATELEALTGVRARVADPLARVELAEGVQAPSSPGSSTVAIGLGIED